MDPLGKVAREYLRKAFEDNVRNARALSDELTKEGMSSEQIEEMLYSSGFEPEVISEIKGRATKKANC